MMITKCPTCGSRKIQHVTRDWQGDWKGQAYTVPMLEFHECPDCGERVYSPQAVRRIQSISPAYKRSPARR